MHPPATNSPRGATPASLRLPRDHREVLHYRRKDFVSAMHPTANLTSDTSSVLRGCYRGPFTHNQHPPELIRLANVTTVLPAPSLHDVMSHPPVRHFLWPSQRVKPTHN